MRNSGIAAVTCTLFLLSVCICAPCKNTDDSLSSPVEAITTSVATNVRLNSPADAAAERARLVREQQQRINRIIAARRIKAVGRSQLSTSSAAGIESTATLIAPAK